MINAAAAYDTELAQKARTPIYKVELVTPSTLDPVGHWKLDEASGSRVDSASGYNLTDNGSVLGTTGLLGNAADFVPASSQYLSLTVSAGHEMQLGDISFTIAAAAYIDSKASNRTIASQYNDSSTNEFPWLLYYDSTADRFRLTVNGGGSSVFVNADTLGSPSTGTWYYIIGWWDRIAETVNIQVNNGTVDSASTAAIDPPTVSTTDFRIGAARTGGSVGMFWDGLIDEVTFYKRVLTSDERTAKYNGGALVAFTIGTIAYEFCNGTPIGGEDIGDDILEPISLDKRVDAEYSRFPVSEFIFLLHDINGIARAAMAVNLLGYRVRFYMSFYDIAWTANKVQMFDGFIADVDFGDGVFRVTARGNMAKALSTVIFNGAKTLLTTAINATATTLTVKDASAFDPAQTTPQSLTRLVLIDQEIITYRTKASTSLSNCIRVGANVFAVPPAFGNSASVAHTANSVVLELPDMTKLTGTNDDSGTNDMHPVDNYFIDVLTTNDPKRAIGDVGLTVNSTQLATVTAALGAGLKFRFLYASPTNAKRFIEEQLCQTFGSYPYEDNAGQIGIKLYRATSEFAPVGAIDDEHVVSVPVLLGNSEKLINTINIHYDENPFDATFPFAATKPFVDETRRARHGRELPLVIESRGIRSTYTNAGGLTWFGLTEAFLTSMADRHLSRFGDVCRKIRCHTVFNRQLIEVADDVSCTFTNVVDMETGTVSIASGKFEVVGMKHHFDTGIIDVELLEYPPA